jgi:hypothetical protein
MQLPDLTGKVTIDNSRAKAALEEVKGAASAMGKSISSSMGAIKFGAELEVGAHIASAAISGLTAAISGTAGYLGDVSAKAQSFSSHISDLGSKAGRTATFMQEVQTAGNLVGVSLDSTATSLAKFNAKLGAGDEKKFLAGLSEINLSVNQLRSMSPEKQIYEISSRIREMGSEAEKANVTRKLFGNLTILPVIKSDLAGVAEEAHRLGNILSDEMVAASDLLEDRLTTLSKTWESFDLQVGGLINQNASLQAFVVGLTTGLANVKGQVLGNTEAFQTFVSDGVILAAKATVTLVDAFQVAMDSANALRLVYLSVENSLLKIARAQMEVEKAFSFGDWGKWAQLDGQIAVANSMIDENVKKAGEIVDKDVEIANAVAMVRAEMVKVQAEVEKVRGKTVDVGDAMATAGRHGGDALAEGFTKAEKAAQKALDKFKASWSYANLPGPGVFMGPPNIYNSTWDGSAKPGGVSLSSDEFTVSHNDLGVKGHGTMTNAEIVALYKSVVEGSTVAAKSTLDFSKALQNIANVAATSSSKLGQAIAGVAGGGAGLASGLGSLFGTGGQTKTEFGTGITGFLGKVGVAGQIASSVLSIGSSLIGFFKHKDKPAAPVTPQATSEAWSSFQESQMGGAMSGLGKAVSGISIGSSADLESQASIASLTFWSVFKQQGFKAAADGLKDVISSLAGSMSQFGTESAAALLGPLRQYADLSENEVFGKVTDGAKGLAQNLAGLTNAQMPITIAQFDAFGQQAVSAYAQAKAAAIDSGLSQEKANEAAYMSVGPLLQTIIDSAGKYGITLDANTQSLVDQAKAAGIAFSTDKTDRLVMSIDALTAALGGVPPAFDKITDAAGRIPREITIDVNERHNSGRGVDQPDGPGFANGTSFRNFGAGKAVMLHGEEAVLTRPQVDRLIGLAVAGAPVSFAAGGGQRDVSARPATPIVINVMLPDGRVLASVVADTIMTEGPEAHSIRTALAGRAGHWSMR